MNDTLDYMTMASAIEASGREMVLTIEGDPDNAVCTLGGCGSAKRVGHDISPRWMSMVSLVDIGSGLWPFAHNATATGSGWWNDLDSSFPPTLSRPPLRAHTLTVYQSATQTQS